MAEKKEGEKSPLQTFKESLTDKKKLKETITEGIKHKSAKVRSLAAKMAFRTQEHAFVKQHVLPLINSDKSKKVLRAISGKMTRKSLNEKLETMWAKPKAKGAKPAAAAEEPKA